MTDKTKPGYRQLRESQHEYNIHRRKVTNAKLEYAIYLLNEDPRRSTADIAKVAGFSSPNAFAVQLGNYGLKTVTELRHERLTELMACWDKYGDEFNTQL